MKKTLNERLIATKAHAEATLWNMNHYQDLSLKAPTPELSKEYMDKMFECSAEYSKSLDEIARLEWEIKQ